MSETVRPTKKQRDILTYIEQFIGEHGYSPSYREIMNGLNYTSVATVSLHVNSLIRRGHLRKRDRSARSLEVVSTLDDEATKFNAIPTAANEEKWLIDKIDQMFDQLEKAEGTIEHGYGELAVLINALRVLGMDAAARSFMPRLALLHVSESNDDVSSQRGL